MHIIRFLKAEDVELTETLLPCVSSEYGVLPLRNLRQFLPVDVLNMNGLEGFVLMQVILENNAAADGRESKSGDSSSLRDSSHVSASDVNNQSVSGSVDRSVSC